MFRIDNPTATPSLPAPKPAGTPGYFAHGNLGAGIPPTILDPDFVNMLQLELENVVVDGGLTPSKTTYTQVRDAIRHMISVAVGAINYVMPGRLINTSGLASGGGDLSADRTISVPKSSVAEVIAGVDDSGAITPLALAGMLGITAGSTGQFRIGTVIVKWGGQRASVVGEITASVIFDDPFPNALWRVFPIPVVATAGYHQDLWIQLIDGASSSSGFSVQYQADDNDDNYASGFDWFAIGN